MAGLPRVKDTSPPRDVWRMVILEPIERMTMALRRGDPFSEAALNDMEALQRRLSAFSNALEERKSVLED